MVISHYSCILSLVLLDKGGFPTPLSAHCRKWQSLYLGLNKDFAGMADSLCLQPGLEHDYQVRPMNLRPSDVVSSLSLGFCRVTHVQEVAS